MFRFLRMIALVLAFVFRRSRLKDAQFLFEMMIFIITMNIGSIMNMESMGVKHPKPDIPIS